MSPLMVRIRSCIFGFSWPRPTMSNACTSGTPAAIMVASWRMKMAMSFGMIFLPAPPNSGLGFFLILSGLTPMRRSSDFTWASVAAVRLPFIRLPLASVPSQAHTTSSVFLFFAGAFAMDQSLVTRLISSRLVTPCRIFLRPDLRRSGTPSSSAWSASCMELQPSMIMRPMSSDTGITW